MGVLLNAWAGGRLATARLFALDETTDLESSGDRELWSLPLGATLSPSADPLGAPAASLVAGMGSQGLWSSQQAQPEWTTFPAGIFSLPHFRQRHCGAPFCSGALSKLTSVRSQSLHSGLTAAGAQMCLCAVCSAPATDGLSFRSIKADSPLFCTSHSTLTQKSRDFL